MKNRQEECRVIGVFADAPAAEHAARELVNAGFAPADVNVRTPDATEPSRRQEQGGGFWDSIKDFFNPDDTREYRAVERSGRTLVVLNTVDDPLQIDLAAEVLRRNGSLRVEDEAGTATRGWNEAFEAPGEGDEARVPVVEEQLRVRKHRDVAGGVRVYTRVTEQPVEADVELRDERVEVERRAANRPAPPDAFQEGVVEALETHEEAVVDKEARTVEEVTLRKKVDRRKEKVRDTVRRQDVEIERVDEGDDRPPKRTP